ncbi:hypothetical protein H4219_001855 [Mycoemilia scoparia]|uniref:Uncharacterized protein n=1 Tax=Mycoemilia scoparia TaxID=417184 RepID=A0A9W8A4T7_9FUNG|nr:hypothetical protein H4219_001855 [Mycoemilia scoparia]
MTMNNKVLSQCIIIVFIMAILAIQVLAGADRVITPMRGTKWVPGEEVQVAFRYVGAIGEMTPGYEIDLVTGDPNNTEIVAILNESYKPSSAGISRLNITVPKDVELGDEYIVRVGDPTTDTEWVYSQKFSIVKSKGGSKKSGGSDEDEDDESLFDDQDTEKDSSNNSNAGLSRFGNGVGSSMFASVVAIACLSIVTSIMVFTN